MSNFNKFGVVLVMVGLVLCYWLTVNHITMLTPHPFQALVSGNKALLVLVAFLMCLLVIWACVPSRRSHPSKRHTTTTFKRKDTQQAKPSVPCYECGHTFFALHEYRYMVGRTRITARLCSDCATDHGAVQMREVPR